MSLLRFLMMISLVVWLGGLIFFAFVLAPTVFSVLPTRHLAGSVVSSALPKLHWMGIVAGVIYLISSIVYFRLTTGTTHTFAARHVLLCLMLLLTLISQFGVSPKMTALRASMGEIDKVSQTDPARVAFDALHVWSTRLESGVFFLGIVVAYLTAAQLQS
jgi:Domain of unknown function (DUF4149)